MTAFASGALRNAPRTDTVCVCVCVCVWEVWRGGWGVLNEYKVKTKKEKQKEENSSWTK